MNEVKSHYQEYLSSDTEIVIARKLGAVGTGFPEMDILGPGSPAGAGKVGFGERGTYIGRMLARIVTLLSADGSIAKNEAEASPGPILRGAGPGDDSVWLHGRDRKAAVV